MFTSLFIVINPNNFLRLPYKIQSGIIIKLVHWLQEAHSRPQNDPYIPSLKFIQIISQMQKYICIKTINDASSSNSKSLETPNIHYE